MKGLGRRQPVIFRDTKKNEVVDGFQEYGQEWRTKRRDEQGRVTTPGSERGEPLPSIYDCRTEQNGLVGKCWAWITNCQSCG